MTLPSRMTILLGTVLLSGGIFVACAGDGVDDTDTAKGGSGGSNSGSGGKSTGTGGSSSGSGGSSSGSGGSSTGSGGSNSGSGGSSSGSGGSSTGSGGSSSSADGLTTVGGYHTSGTLKGYMWTSSDAKGSPPGTSTISPADFSLNSKICVSGTAAKVPSMTDYGTYWGALVGWNINQSDMGMNPPVSTAVVTGTINVGISGSKVPAALRVKVAVGTGAAAVDYCADIKAGSNAIKATDLKKECWITGGTPYAGEPVAAIAVQVVTNITAESPFDFCVTGLTVTP